MVDQPAFDDLAFVSLDVHLDEVDSLHVEARRQIVEPSNFDPGAVARTDDRVGHEGAGAIGVGVAHLRGLVFVAQRDVHADAVQMARCMDVSLPVSVCLRHRLECHDATGRLGKENGGAADVGSDIEHHVLLAHKGRIEPRHARLEPIRPHGPAHRGLDPVQGAGPHRSQVGVVRANSIGLAADRKPYFGRLHVLIPFFVCAAEPAAIAPDSRKLPRQPVYSCPSATRAAYSRSSMHITISES